MWRVLDEFSFLKVVLRRWYFGDDDEREVGDDGYGYNRYGDDIFIVYKNLRDFIVDCLSKVKLFGW